MKKTKLVAARFTNDRFKLLDRFSKSEKCSRSEILQKAFDQYIESKTSPTVSEVFAKLFDSGFVGSHSTDEQLSTNYKKELSKILSSKHGNN